MISYSKWLRKKTDRSNLINKKYERNDCNRFWSEINQFWKAATWKVWNSKCEWMVLWEMIGMLMVGYYIPMKNFSQYHGKCKSSVTINWYWFMIKSYLRMEELTW